MISHQRQGYMECALATVVGLHGGTLQDGRELFRQHAVSRGVPYAPEYSYCVNSSGFSWLVEEFLSVMLPGYEHSSKVRVSPGDNSRCTRPTNLKGMGWLRVFDLDGPNHAMPYENRLVYDPNLPAPMSWSDWIGSYSKNYPGHLFSYVVVEEQHD